MHTHSVIYGSNFARKHNERFHDGLPVRTSNGLETYYGRHKADNAELLSAMIGVDSSGGESSDRSTEAWSASSAGSSMDVGGRGKAASSGGGGSSRSALAAPEIEWNEFPTSFFMMHAVVKALVRVEKFLNGKTFREDEDFCCHDSSESSSSSSSRSSSGVAAVKEKVQEGQAMERRLAARWPSSFPQVLRELSAGQMGHLLEPWSSILEDFSADATQLKPALTIAIFRPFGGMLPPKRAEEGLHLAAASSSSSGSGSGYESAVGGTNNDGDGSPNSCGSEHGSEQSSGGSDVSRECDERCGGVLRWITNGPLFEEFQPSWPSEAFPTHCEHHNTPMRFRLGVSAAASGAP